MGSGAGYPDGGTFAGLVDGCNQLPGECDIGYRAARFRNDDENLAVVREEIGGGAVQVERLGSLLESRHDQIAQGEGVGGDDIGDAARGRQLCFGFAQRRSNLFRCQELPEACCIRRSNKELGPGDGIAYEVGKGLCFVGVIDAVLTLLKAGGPSTESLRSLPAKTSASLMSSSLSPSRRK